MAVLPPTIFASIVTSSKYELSRVSEVIGNECNGNSEEFLKACEDLDYERTNEILDEAFKSLTGHNSISMGLLYFASGLAHQIPNIEYEVTDAFSDVDKIRALDKHYLQIMAVLMMDESTDISRKMSKSGDSFWDKAKGILGKLVISRSKNGITLMELIHALSAVYAKTDRFLNSGR